MHGLRLLLRGRHPAYDLPVDAAIANDLEEEYRAQPLGRRLRQVLRMLQRDLRLLATGQAALCRERAPPATQRVLWIYTWTTLGDSIMDLAARTSLPPGIEIDLCIASSLAPLYAADLRFRSVYTRLADCADDYDFLLLHVLDSRTLRQIRRRFPRTPFATMLGYLQGERFARLAFADARLRRIFGLATAAPPLPALHLGERRPSPSGRFEIAVALGARDPRRAYPHWPDALRAVAARWPAARPPPRFHLLGAADPVPARDRLGADFIAAHCTDLVDRLGLLESAQAIRDSDAFLGADGGLMHIASAMRRPGLALFTRIEPGMRLPEGSALQPLLNDAGLAAMPPDAVAAAFLAALPGGAHDTLTPT